MANISITDQNDVTYVYQDAGRDKSGSRFFYVEGENNFLTKELRVSTQRNGSNTADRVTIVMANPFLGGFCEDTCELHNIPARVTITLPLLANGEERERALTLLAEALLDPQIVTAVRTGHS